MIETIGIIWWIDPCETTTDLERITKEADFPVYKSAGVIIDCGTFYRVIQDEQVHPNWTKGESKNKATNVPKCLVKKHVFYEVDENDIIRL